MQGPRFVGKYSGKRGRVRDFLDLGAGYDDEGDDFIDNSEAVCFPSRIIYSLFYIHVIYFFSIKIFN